MRPASPSLTRWLVALLVTVALPAARAEPVPVEQDPTHRLRLDNEHVRVFDVWVAPGAATMLHTHLLVGVSIRLADGRVRDEPLGAAPVEVEIVRGEVRYASHPQPVTHRVVAVGDKPFHNLFIELHRPSGLPDPGAVPAPGLEIPLDHERVRVLRRILAPGEAAPLHTHSLPGLGIALTDGRLEVIGADGTTRVVELTAGSFQWREAGVTHALRNVGSSAVELVDVDIK